MNVLARVLLGMLLTAGLAMSAPAVVVACSCAEASEEQHFAGADLVVEGVVTRSDDPFFGLPIVSTADPITYTIAVDKVLKGEAGDEVEVRTARDEASCGLSLAVGQRWRLYAHRGDEGLNVGLCSGNELLRQQAPTAGESFSESQPGPMEAALSWLPAAIGGLIGLLALIVFRPLARS